MEQSTTRAAWATGGAFFGAMLLIILGIWQVFLGIAAIAKDNVFVTSGDYIYNINLTGWGWIHLILGALGALAGFFIFTGATWARVLGIAFAALSAIGHFLFLPYYPIWSILTIALAIFVIWALVVWNPSDAIE